MPDSTDSTSKLRKLCEAAGWELHNEDGSMTDHRYRRSRPLESRDDAHALLTRLVEKLGETVYGTHNETFAEQVNSKVEDYFWAAYKGGLDDADDRRAAIGFALNIEPASLIDAMYEALPGNLKQMH